MNTFRTKAGNTGWPYGGIAIAFQEFMKPCIRCIAMAGLFGTLVHPTAQSTPLEIVDVPYRCATCSGLELPDHQAQPLVFETTNGFTMPSHVQYYEIIPGVIREADLEPFRIYVHLGREVNRVYASSMNSYFSVPRLEFLDDGTDGDLVAGDHIYTSGSFRMTQSYPQPLSYYGQPSLDGMNYITVVSHIMVEETDGSEDEFLIPPEIGVLEPSIPTAQIATLTSDIQVASHLVNIRQTGAPAAQNYLHYLGGDLATQLQNLTKNIYNAIPDEYDFIVVLSAMHGEQIPRTTTPNFNAGMHITVKNTIAGIGQSPFDHSTNFGSSGRLLSVNLLDTAERGNYINNALHEMTHQWSAFINSHPDIKYDYAHWSGWSNIGSILGGYAWLPQPDGSWMLDENQCRFNLRHMAPIDLYLAGLLPADEVPLIMAYDKTSKSPFLRIRDGDPILPEEITATATIDDIIAFHGVRYPPLLDAQHHFTVLFVVESIDRLLIPDEMTFYNRLARDFERILAPDEPDPIYGKNWVPASRYYASTATLSSRVTGWDSDNDHLYDDWEMTYFSNLVHTGESDPDHDGLANFAEQAYLTHPNKADRQAPLRIYQTDEYIKLEYTTFLPTLNYSLETATELRIPTEWNSSDTPFYSVGPHRRHLFPKALIGSEEQFPPVLFGRSKVVEEP